MEKAINVVIDVYEDVIAKIVRDQTKDLRDQTEDLREQVKRNTTILEFIAEALNVNIDPIPEPADDD